MLGFIHIEKTAGSTMVSILRKSFGVNHADVRSWETPWQSEVSNFTYNDLLRTKRIYINLQSIAGHAIKPYIELKQAELSLRYFTFLRDPLKRCASHYQYQIQKMNKKIKFEDWIMHDNYRNFQCRRICGSESAQKAIEILESQIEFVGIVENFDASLVLMKSIFPMLDIHYRSRNVAADNSIKNKLLPSGKERSILEEANREDAILYKYALDEIYPRQVVGYGNEFDNSVEKFQCENKDASPGKEKFTPKVIRHCLYRPAMKIYRFKKRITKK